MATKLKRPCNHPGCGALISSGSRCIKHTKQFHIDYRKSRTDTDEQRFYGSQEWREISLQHRREHPVCQQCGIKPSELVHHRVPVRQGGDRLLKSNFIAVCRSCQALAHHGNK